MKPEQEIHRLTLEIIRHPKYQSLAGVIMMGEVEFDESIPTARTDGLGVCYNPSWFRALPSVAIKRFVILHENGHKALRQIRVWQHLWKDDARSANKAADFVINLWLTDIDDGEGFIECSKDWCLDERFRGMDTGEVFRLLKEEGEGGGKGKGGGAGDGEPLDEHDIDAYDKLTAEEKEELGKAVDTALRQGGILAGRGAGGMDRTIASSMDSEVNWQEQLQEFLRAHCTDKQFSTWSKPNRKYIYSGTYMPGMSGETIGRVGLFVDTSGSIGNDALSMALAEVCGVAEQLQPEVVDLMYWDTTIAQHEKYGPGEYEMIRNSTKPAGGGGTSPSCITKYLKEKDVKLECAIVMTDGHVGNDWGGAWPCPVLWVMIGNQRATAETGKTLHIR